LVWNISFRVNKKILLRSRHLKISFLLGPQYWRRMGDFGLHILYQNPYSNKSFHTAKAKREL